MLNWFKRRLAATQALAPTPPPALAEPPVKTAPEPVQAGPEPSLVSGPRSEAALAGTQARLQSLIRERAVAIQATLERKPYADEVRQLLELVMSAEEATIRPIPTAARHAMTLARNPESNLNEVADAFERDPSLAEGLLRLANSAWYRGGDEQVDSLREALHRTGSSGAEVVIMENALKGTLCRPGGAYDSLVAQVWLHLSRTAPMARSLAGTFGMDPDTAFMLGLLHDVGKLVLFDAMSEFRRRMRQATHLPYPVLRELIMQLHEPLGGLAILRWGLEPDRAAAVADHHRHAQPHRVEPASELLFLAERADLALTFGRPCDLDPWIEEGGLTIGPATLERALNAATDGTLRFVRTNEEGEPSRAA